VSDFTSRILSIFTADNSSHVEALKGIKKAEQDVQKTEAEGHEARTGFAESWTKGLADVNAGLELAKKAIEFGKEAFDAYADQLRLTAAAGGADIDRLREAAMGLRTEDELLAFAAKTRNGVIKASQGDMEIAERAMIALTRAGFDQAEVTDKITDAMVKGKTRGLDAFGLAIKEGTTPLETYKNIMGALADKASGVKDGSATAAEGVQAMGVSMHDSIDNMKEAIGHLVTAFAPLIKVLSDTIGLVAKAVEGWSQFGEWLVGTGDMSLTDMLGKEQGGKMEKLRAEMMQGIKNYMDTGNPYEAASLYKGQGGRGVTTAGGGDNVFDPIADEMMKKFAAGTLDLIAKGGKVKTGGTDSAGPSFTMLNFGRDIQGDADALVEEFHRAMGIAVKKAGQMSLEGQQLIDAPALQHADFQAGQADFAKQAAEFQKQAKLAQDAAHKEKETSFLESTFGKLEEFNAYHEAFGMLTASVTSAMDAWITGSESMGTAIKKTIGSALKALASQLAVEALKHGAYALGSLAFGDVAGASAHGLAAAEFAVAAAAAAVAAKEMGHGGADYGKGKAASGGGSAGGGHGDSHGGGSGDGGKPGNVTYVIPYGDAFFDLSETGKRRKAQEIVNRAQPNGHGFSNS
jgi:hypothetical protein